MKVTKINPAQIDDFTRVMIEAVIALGGVRVEYDITRGKRSSSVRFTLRTTHKASPWMRRSASGRATNGVTWEAHRIVLQALFDAFPDITIKSALATYKGAADFKEKFPQTFNHNAGSRMNPVAFGEL